MNFHNFIRYMLCKILHIDQKITPLPFSTTLLFYLYAYHCICENYHKIQNFIRNVIQKSSVLSEKVSTFFFTYTLIVFVCLSQYLRFLLKKSSVFKIFLFYQPFYLYVRCKSSELIENISTSISILF